MCDSEQHQQHQLHQRLQQQQESSVKPEPLTVELNSQWQPKQPQFRLKKQLPADSPLGPSKLAHQFWFSYPPPGAGGGSSNSKTSQTDEEKQRDRQRCEREAKKEEQDALNYKRDKESKEARLLDFEIRRQQEREKKKEHQQQLQQQQQQQQQQTCEKSPPTTSGQAQQHLQQQQNQDETEQELVASSSAPTPIIPTPPDRGLPPAFRSRSIEREILYERKRQYSTVEALESKKPSISTPLPLLPPAVTGSTTATQPPAAALPPLPPTPKTPSAVVAGPPATAAAATAAIIPILPLGVATLRDDSTESEEQSVTCTHHHAESCHRIM